MSGPTRQTVVTVAHLRAEIAKFAKAIKDSGAKAE